MSDGAPKGVAREKDVISGEWLVKLAAALAKVPGSKGSEADCSWATWMETVKRPWEKCVPVVTRDSWVSEREIVLSGDWHSIDSEGGKPGRLPIFFNKSS